MLICCSSKSAKLKPLANVNADIPRAFRNNGLKSEKLQEIWRNNKKIIMNSKIFVELIKSVNAKMKYEKRKTILLINNMFSHTSITSISNVKIQLFLLNCLLQPFD